MPTLKLITGYDQGTHLGLLTGNTGSKYVDFNAGTLGTNIQILSAAALGAGSGLRISGTNTNVRYGSDNLGTGAVVCHGFWWRVSTDPSATKQFLVFFVSGVSEAGLRWNPTSDKIETYGADFTVGIGSSTSTHAVGEWVWVDVMYDATANPHQLRWAINGVIQTTATAPNAATTISGLLHGESSSGTATGAFDYDHGVFSVTAADFPLGMHRVFCALVDPAGTVTVSGSTANFATFTANGTIAAWNATTARDNTDENPPTISASADGAVQQTTSTTDFMRFPMTTTALTEGETFVGARMVACGWAASATANTLGFRSFNGTTQTILQAGTVDPNFDNSTTNPAWCCKMLTAADVDSQAKVDGLCIDVGFSSNAGVDAGIHAVYVEIAVAQQRLQPIVSVGRYPR